MNTKSTILLTGGLGYIGSHTAVELIENNFNVVILDNFSNCDITVLERIESIVKLKPFFYEGDIRDIFFLRYIFSSHKFDAVIHFAGLKSISESIENPLSYYDNNFYGSLNLLKTMKDFNVNKIIFSSSANVYGNPVTLPIDEHHQIAPTNPYGHSKSMVEKMLNSLFLSDNSWSIKILRYFNPVGAHPSGLLGENPLGTPDNLMPLINQVASGRIGHISVYGNNYSTIDGTGVRDYIHVSDLATGHFKTLEYLFEKNGFDIFNLGTGFGYSVLELIKAFEVANNIVIPYEFCERRPGDVDAAIADPTLSRMTLKWKCEKSLADMCLDSWNWYRKL